MAAVGFVGRPRGVTNVAMVSAVICGLPRRPLRTPALTLGPTGGRDGHRPVTSLSATAVKTWMRTIKLHDQGRSSGRKHRGSCVSRRVFACTSSYILSLSDAQNEWYMPGIILIRFKSRFFALRFSHQLKQTWRVAFQTISSIRRNNTHLAVKTIIHAGDCNAKNRKMVGHGSFCNISNTRHYDRHTSGRAFKSQGGRHSYAATRTGVTAVVRTATVNIGWFSSSTVVKRSHHRPLPR